MTIKRPNIPRTIRKIYAHSVHSFTPTSTISGRLSRVARATAVDSRVDRDMSFGCVRITNLLLVLWLSFTYEKKKDSFNSSLLSYHNPIPSSKATFITEEQVNKFFVKWDSKNCVKLIYPALAPHFHMSRRSKINIESNTATLCIKWQITIIMVYF